MRLYIFLLSVLLSYTSMAQNYGAGVIHGTGEPKPVNFDIKNPSILYLDSLGQSFYVTNKTNGVYKLASPSMRYVRDFYNIYFAENQIIPFSFIHTELRNRSNNNILHGYYVVKMTTAGGDVTKIATLDMSSIPNLILSPPEYLVSNNDYFVIRYERNILKECRQIIDKSRFVFQQIQDSILVHRTEIDNLKAQKGTNLISTNYTYVPFLHTKCSDEVNTDPVSYVTGQYGTSNMPHFFAVPNIMEGDTLIGLQIDFCDVSNINIGIRIVRVNNDGVIQAFIPPHLSIINAFQTSKYFESELLFYSNNRILKKNDRIMFFVFGFYQPDPQNPVIVKKPLGLSATLVIKPKIKNE